MAGRWDAVLFQDNASFLRNLSFVIDWIILMYKTITGNGVVCLVWFGLDIHGESNRMKRIKSKPEHTRRDDDENGKKKIYEQLQQQQQQQQLSTK